MAISPGCHRVKSPASQIKTADAATADQLTYGFYSVEMHAWRWTAGKLKVGLRPPPGWTQRGAKLRLDLFIPDAQILELGPMTLSASAADHPLEPETFATPGTHVYWGDIPAEVLNSNIVPVAFRFDKYGPWEQKGREMRAVVTAVGLFAK